MKSKIHTEAENERFTALLDPQLIARLKILAVQRRCSASELVRSALAQVLDEHERDTLNSGVGKIRA